MADPLYTFIRRTLPEEVSELLADGVKDLEEARFYERLTAPIVQKLLVHGNESTVGGAAASLPKDAWQSFLTRRLSQLLNDTNSQGDHYLLMIAAIAALQAFLQSNVTGPPLPFSPSSVLFGRSFCSDAKDRDAVRDGIRKSLGVDGEAVYRLTPNVELLCFARVILEHPQIRTCSGATWAKLRVDFVHQRVLSEVSPTLQRQLYDGMDSVDEILHAKLVDSPFSDIVPPFCLEKAAVHTHHGLDIRAREALEFAAKRRKFTHALTGLLGKRTKYQEKDTSQLVVLARSYDENEMASDNNSKSIQANAGREKNPQSHPQALDLNDDTLLENIAFSQTPSKSPEVLETTTLPESLTSLDPSAQPRLDAWDSIILLSLASSITNTRPSDGLTREETLPYATRVLADGSVNWQVYTQALLIRSRIEGYRSRTTERGLLQLQSLVDQVISETTGSKSMDPTEVDTSNDVPAIAINDKPTIESATTFLPRASSSESAPASVRLLYIHSLASPTRWELEAELASRWISLGGLRSALEIYERLEMWPEAALCWAATEREDKARKIVRSLLFSPSDDLATNGQSNATIDRSEGVFDGPPRDPPPADAPRLYCILGELDSDLAMYEKAWEVSGARYARAQRSIGRHWFSQSVKGGGDAQNSLRKAAAAYSKSLKISQLHGQSWFALGCALLELQEFDKAAEAFARVVQLDETDAESWSNLATSLLKKSSTSSIVVESAEQDLQDETGEGRSDSAKDPQQNIRAALRALRRAASLKHNDARIWDNLMTVALSLKPPSYSDVLSALRRVIAIRGPSKGEAAIDVDVLEILMREVISIDYCLVDGSGTKAVNPAVTRGLPRLFVQLLHDEVIPIITTSPRLWRVASTTALWQDRPGEALDALEKGWRAAMANPSGWEDGDKSGWDAVVEATLDLADGYESLGDRPREASIDQPSQEQVDVVAKDWKFKARSAIRAVMGKAKSAWEDDEGYDRLKDRLNDLKS